ncbi:MAG: hypothetical protein EZS28_015008 [Streblomastix strix]|uniref:Uncharacterized protein n=1 Tax=Streblomastix strix TaxID=222440 RepID=A0A5J4W3K8_9EUKA|nr:MAG: hypothetical protein EZS28_015008 [Streblomastix strix]
MAHNVYKLAIDFGFIYERKDRDKNNDEKITYGYIIPRESMTERRAPLLIRSQQDIELYKEYIQSVIISVQEKTLIDTKQKYIAVYSVCAMTYLLPISGKPIPNIQIHLIPTLAYQKQQLDNCQKILRRKDIVIVKFFIK